MFKPLIKVDSFQIDIVIMFVLQQILVNCRLYNRKCTNQYRINVSQVQSLIQDILPIVPVFTIAPVIIQRKANVALTVLCRRKSRQENANRNISNKVSRTPTIFQVFTQTVIGKR